MASLEDVVQAYDLEFESSRDVVADICHQADRLNGCRLHVLGGEDEHKWIVFTKGPLGDDADGVLALLRERAEDDPDAIDV